MTQDVKIAQGALALAYQDFAPEGPARAVVLLVHGFASNRKVNWFSTGWVTFLTSAGYRVIAFDHRGHGESEKPYENKDFLPERMAEDAVAVLDAAGVSQAFVIGFSMGARVTAMLAAKFPERVRTIVLAGLGETLIKGQGDSEAIALALEAEDPASIEDLSARAFRTFADKTRSDRRALAACMRAPRHTMNAELLGTITAPVLVVIGEEDGIAGPAQPLLNALANATFLPLNGKDHMSSVGAPLFKEEVSRFFAGHE